MLEWPFGPYFLIRKRIRVGSKRRELLQMDFRNHSTVWNDRSNQNVPVVHIRDGSHGALRVVPRGGNPRGTND